MMGPLLIRADANSDIGAGHVMRCLAVAQGWQDEGGDTVFASAPLSAGLLERLRQEKCGLELITAPSGSVEDAGEAIAHARRLGAAWIVVDGYQFPAGFQKHFKEAGLCVMVIDDHGNAGDYAADVILDQNLGAQAACYSNRGRDTQLLLGPRFALLRREFLRHRSVPRPVSEIARKILVTLGGSDPENATAKVIEALEHVNIDDLEVIVVMGSENRHAAELQRSASRSRARVELRRNVSDMAELMIWGDAAITAAGSTTYERTLLGLPGLMLVLADNQELVADAANRAGIGFNLGRPGDISSKELAGRLTELLRDAATRRAMIERGREIVDGDGARRVVAVLSPKPALTLRRAQASDARLLWEWANDPTTRAVSFTPDAIPWERHQDWFAAKLADPQCIFFIAANEQGVPVGQIRFDASDGDLVVSTSVRASWRGRGIATRMIRAACAALPPALGFGRIIALIKEDNEASIRAFSNAGFEFEGRKEVRGMPARQYVLKPARSR
jgi:UDP-2,4-diacetamido-2,4,6-trideoxy-beta-L-altropyranose hydrolase